MKAERRYKFTFNLQTKKAYKSLKFIKSNKPYTKPQALFWHKFKFLKFASQILKADSSSLKFDDYLFV
ncbi:hypothetical protein [Campylobacter sp. RM15925]|uniref:hypothetical protein n=1 Tax=Campylobacter sp. RM15925 TaxID=1705724 RepID=UPI0014727760|nr:hypothetical protein [Campylobacter sp. RM15925]